MEDLYCDSDNAFILTCILESNRLHYKINTENKTAYYFCYPLDLSKRNLLLNEPNLYYTKTVNHETMEVFKNNKVIMTLTFPRERDIFQYVSNRVRVLSPSTTASILACILIILTFAGYVIIRIHLIKHQLLNYMPDIMDDDLIHTLFLGSINILVISCVIILFIGSGQEIMRYWYDKLEINTVRSFFYELVMPLVGSNLIIYVMLCVVSSNLIIYVMACIKNHITLFLILLNTITAASCNLLWLLKTSGKNYWTKIKMYLSFTGLFFIILLGCTVLLFYTKAELPDLLTFFKNDTYYLGLLIALFLLGILAPLFAEYDNVTTPKNAKQWGYRIILTLFMLPFLIVPTIFLFYFNIIKNSRVGEYTL